MRMSPILLTLSFFAGLTLSSQPARAELKRYDALIGNHAVIVVTVDSDGPDTLTVRRGYDNGTSVSYQLNLTTGALHASEDFGGKSKTIPVDRSQISVVRDWLAYTVAPQRYDWGVFGDKVLNLELNPVLRRIDELLGDDSRNQKNCALYRSSGEAMVTTGGASAELGSFAAEVQEVWVRDGYELVLSNSHDWANADRTLLRARGAAEPELSELVALPSVEQGGRRFTVVGSELEGQVQAYICRPWYF